MVMEELRDGEEEQPKAEDRGQYAQDQDGGDSLILAACATGGGIALADGVRAGPAAGCRAHTDPRTEGGQQQKRDADDDADVEHGNRVLSKPECLGYSITRCCDEPVRHGKLLETARDMDV